MSGDGGTGISGEESVDLSQWVGREERVEGVLDPSHARAVAALFDDFPEGVAAGDPLPPLWHWFYFPPVVRASELGPDGHPRRGGFLPPVPLPRRMWAGGRVHFHAPLPVGAPAVRHSRIVSVEEKSGRSGALVLVTVEHRILHEGAAAVVEEQDLIYREAPTAEAATPGPGRAAGGTGDSIETAVPPGWDWQDRTSTDPVLLFRFSALTFNGHRIHYDHPYTTGVEGYPGLVVHGPLSALLLMRSGCARSEVAPGTFSYRGRSPLFCGESMTLVGRREEVDSGGTPATALEVVAPDGRTAMEARITWHASPLRP